LFLLQALSSWHGKCAPCRSDCTNGRDDEPRGPPDRARGVKAILCSIQPTLG